jgi:hypothetical protein
MVDRLITRGIKDVLSKYFENGDELGKSITFNSWTGLIRLESLKLKKGVADALSLPVDIVLCSIGLLEVSIPWTALSTEPVRVTLENMCVLLKCNYKLQQQSKMGAKQAAKQAQLVAADVHLHQVKSQEKNKSKAASGSGYLDSLKEMALNIALQSMFKNIVNNFELEVKNIHIRFEDMESSPVTDFCFGITSDSVSVGSPDGPGTERIIKDKESAAVFSKKFSVCRQAIYWNPLSHASANICGRPLAEKFHSEIEEVMLKKLMPRHRHQFLDYTGHRFLLRPLDFEMTSEIAVDVADKSLSVSEMLFWCCYRLTHVMFPCIAG